MLSGEGDRVKERSDQAGKGVGIPLQNKGIRAFWEIKLSDLVHTLVKIILLEYSLFNN